MNHLEHQDYCRIWAQLVNILAFENILTGKEAEVIGAFLAVDRGDLKGLAFKTTGRQIVRERLGLSHQNLSNVLDRLEKKKVIFPDERTGYNVHPMLVFPGTNGIIEIEFKDAEKEEPNGQKD